MIDINNQIYRITDYNEDADVPEDMDKMATSIENLLNRIMAVIGATVELNIDENYVMTLNLKNDAGNIISTDEIDFPMESMIVNASYSNGVLTLTLQNGNTLDVNISDIIDGLVSQSDFDEAVEELEETIQNNVEEINEAIQENYKEIIKLKNIVEEQEENKNLLLIEDKLVDANAYSVDSEKILSSTVNNIEYNYAETTSFNYGKAIPFIYDETKKYQYIYFPYLKVETDGYVSIAICNNEFIGKWANQNNGKLTQIKNYIKAGTYQNYVISLKDIDYNVLKDGENYWLMFYKLSTEDNPTYSNITEITFRKITNHTTQLSDWVNTDSKLYFLTNWGAYNWSEFSSSYYNNGIPVFGLSVEYPYRLDLENYIKNVAEVTNKLSGKKINFVGDSITRGVGGNLNGGIVEKPFPTIIQENTSCVSNNYGIAGSTIGGDGTTINEITGVAMGYQPMINRLNNMDINSDINVIFGGTNDALADRQVPLGEFNDTTNLSFYGALRNICVYLLNNFPTKYNFFVTPLKRQNQETGNRFGLTLKDYADAIVEVANYYGFPVLDLYNEMGGTPLNSTWKNNNMADGTHPNQNYYYVIANKIIDFLNSQI